MASLLLRLGLQEVLREDEELGPFSALCSGAQSQAFMEPDCLLVGGREWSGEWVTDSLNPEKLKEAMGGASTVTKWIRFNC